MSERSYYCSMKFKYLKIDAESNTVYNCHAAEPHPIDFAWLSSNSGQLFNTNINVRERTMMLHNERNSSCEQNCWEAEDKNAISPRIYQNGTEKTHFNPVTNPSIIEFTSTSDCNLTCSYCTKEYSGAWRRDIINNGEYDISHFADNRYKLLPRDLLLTKISQQSLRKSAKYQQLVEEVVKLTNKSTCVIITGGEPLLDNNLVSNIKLLSHVAIIEIFTGVGVSQARFKKVMDELKEFSNVRFMISAESIEKNLEFNRYGIKWLEFIQKIEYMKRHNLNFRFSSTLSNLTMFSFADFANYFTEENIVVTFAYQPRFLAPYVLDYDSKELIKDKINSSRNSLSDIDKERIIQSMEHTPDEKHKTSLREFLIEFTSRRPDLSLNIFPAIFLEWLDIKNVV
jgi:organic radical activating enzyme